MARPENPSAARHEAGPAGPPQAGAGHGQPSDPHPVNLLPTQQQSAYRYYSVYSRDFTAVYAR